MYRRANGVQTDRVNCREASLLKRQNAKVIFQIVRGGQKEKKGGEMRIKS